MKKIKIVVLNIQEITQIEKNNMNSKLFLTKDQKWYFVSKFQKEDKKIPELINVKYNLLIFDDEKDWENLFNKLLNISIQHAKKINNEILM